MMKQSRYEKLLNFYSCRVGRARIANICLVRMDQIMSDFCVYAMCSKRVTLCHYVTDHTRLPTHPGLKLSLLVACITAYFRYVCTIVTNISKKSVRAQIVYTLAHLNTYIKGCLPSNTHGQKKCFSY